MKIAVASGKGGTGKTTIATSLAFVAGKGATYADCDVEEPNGHLFLKPEIEKSEPFGVLVPHVNLDQCTFCGECREACRYNAIAVLPKTVMIFQELCHSCGGCVVVCPEKAISEKTRETGIIEIGKSNDIGFIHGKLNVGESMSPPLIYEVIRRLPDEGLVIIDAPPGTSCPVIATVKDADVCLLVTEPTPFGLNDLILAVEMVRALGVPFGVIINRDGIGDQNVDAYCLAQKIPVIARIPEQRKIAENYSRGYLIAQAIPETASVFESILSWARHNAKLKTRRAI